MSAIQILIADDHEVVRTGVRSLLVGEFNVCGEATSLDSLRDQMSTITPDLVLLDVRLGDSDGLDAVKELRNRTPPVNVLIFSAHDNPSHEARAYSDGANGYVYKTSEREKLLDAVRRAAAGEMLWDRTDQRRLTNFVKAAGNGVGEHAPLTGREQEVLRILATGATNKQISKELGISAETVKEHVQHVLRKTGTTDRTQAAVWAARNGLV